ncbi:MAG: PQQ-binding-like beta-propeller repeat protein [Planctomycetota bacterium]|nr:PQQ-binding-like beta-propeller repeat protein [Planctomycetota bacterium]
MAVYLFRAWMGAPVFLFALVSLALPVSLRGDESGQARSILDATGVRGGLVVHLGSGNGRLTAALRRNAGYQVHGLDTDREKVEDAREYIHTLGIYGDVAVDRYDGDRLPYIDNLVNLVVAEDLGDVSMEEVLRVLAPRGVAYARVKGEWKKTVKPRPENIDEWTHFMHGPGGNAVAHDTVVGPPEHLQWVGSPRWSRHHDRMASMSALVSSNGRIIYIMDEGSRITIQTPSSWKLIARDAFNGVILWKRSIGKWHHHLWPLKSGPTQLARRLVSIGDRIYVTRGLIAPLEEIDAVTGKTLRVYENSGATEEVIVSDGLVLALANDELTQLAGYVPKFNVGDQRRVLTEFVWNKKPRRVVAYEAGSGKKLWQKTASVAPLTLAADAGGVYFHDGQKVVCLDRKTGEEAWHSEPAGRGKNGSFNFGPKLVVHEGVVIFAGGNREMRAFASASGKLLWKAPHARGGYQSPEDLLVIDGKVWSAPTTSGRDSGVFTGRDLKTGEVKVEFSPTVKTYWFHHRCYMAKATDNFLLTSRTGIEFVDFKKKDWDIHHWVRGGCLYGVMPCNGLTYAPPHNCACYPEAKLYGINALAAGSKSRKAAGKIPAARRFESGPAWGKVAGAAARPGDWPTYRGNATRTGYSATKVQGSIRPTWEVKLGGKVTPPVIADGRLFLARVNQHAVHAFDEKTGRQQWMYTAGGRVDSPPTVHRGRVLFGSADGWIYCLRATDGVLAWRFRGAPRDERLMSFEQLESVWPVHGSVLVKDDSIYCVAGRSNFLDGGLRFIQLDLSGKLVKESLIDDRDPDTGKDIQDRLQTLQMSTGLSDILSSDGQYIYMRSQQFDSGGNRIGIGPHSGDVTKQGAVQSGSTAHLFAPMGYLDETYFHRAYWVYGRSSAGGHNGYYQAGKYAPAGRILVSDGKDVYGFGRKPQYLKWTTTIEHQLFSTSREAPPQALSDVGSSLFNKAARRTGGTAMVQVPISKSLDPTGKSLTVEAWVKSAGPNGVVIARGGPAQGYALLLQKGKPQFSVRSNDELSTVSGPARVVKRWVHLAGVLGDDKQLRLYVDGKLVAAAKAVGPLTGDPAQPTEVGADVQSAVGNYTSPLGFKGIIDEVQVYFRALSDDEIASRHSATGATPDAALVLSLSFDNGRAADASVHKNNGTVSGAKAVDGKFKAGMQFAGGKAGGKKTPARGSFVQRKWEADIPLYARAMALAGKTLFVAGPPDLINEEETFKKIMDRDPKVAEKLRQQNEALLGDQGGILWVVDATSGKKLAELKLKSLPAWDGLAAANGRLFLSTADGKIICFGE